MEEKDILKLWSDYDRKLEESLSFNRSYAEEITKIKIRSFIVSMKPFKIFTIAIGVVWVAFVDVLIINLFSTANPFFLISAGIHVLLTKLAIGIYLYQLILIHHVDVNEPIVVTQEKLARLKSSILWVARLLFLQLPVWTTFYLNSSMLENGNMVLYIVQAIVTLSFTYVAVWIFLNIKYENRDKKWFQFLFSGSEWTPAIKALELTKELQVFKK